MLVHVIRGCHTIIHTHTNSISYVRIGAKYYFRYMKNTIFIYTMYLILAIIVLRALGVPFNSDKFFQNIFKLLRSLDWLLMILGWVTTGFFTEKLLKRIGIENKSIIIISIVLASIVYFYFVMQYFLMVDSLFYFE